MRAVLPGQPRDELQAVCTGLWNDRQFIAYITGSAFVVLDSADNIVQTIYNDDDDTLLDAIAIDEGSGKIATCSSTHLYIYAPHGQDEDVLRWSLQASLQFESQIETKSTLSWGIDEELLVGNANLTLYATHDALSQIWFCQLANPVKYACMSYDSAYIATTGSHDRLVKVWRRLSFGSDDVQFDFTYLHQTRAVTHLRWRRPHHHHQTIDNVLYTISADDILRIWAAIDPHGVQIQQLWAQLNLLESIQSRTADPATAIRYAFIIDGKDFSRATEYAVQHSNTESEADDHALQHLVQVANRSPEVCVVLDNHGHMSAWGLENVGCKARKTSNIFNIAHISDLSIDLQSLGSDYVKIYNCCAQKTGSLKILFHHFNGTIQVYESNLSHLFDPSSRPSRLDLVALWTGHSSSIRRIVRDSSGSAIATRTDNDDTIIWHDKNIKTGAVLNRQSIMSADEPIQQICVIRRGQFVVYLHHTKLTLWDCRQSHGNLLATRPYKSDGGSPSILLLPEKDTDSEVARIAIVNSKFRGIVWRIELSTHGGGLEADEDTIMTETRSFDLGGNLDFAHILPVDPAGFERIMSDSLDIFSGDVAISCTKSGIIRTWSARFDTNDHGIEWLQTSSIETGIRNLSLLSGTSNKKVALVDEQKLQLTIWDTRSGQLEFTQNYDGINTINDLDWNMTPESQSILAIGFSHSVSLLAQMRFDYLNEDPAWATIQVFNMRDLTPHPIGDSAWLSDGSFVVAAGIQLFVFDASLENHPVLDNNLRRPQHKREHESRWNLFDVVNRLNGPLPVFHPQFLSQCILAGNIVFVQKILTTLLRTLSYHVEGEEINNLLGIPIEEVYTESSDRRTAERSKEMSSAYADFEENASSDSLTEDNAARLVDRLREVNISQLSSKDQLQLSDIVDCMALVEKQRRSMDENAARFSLFFRLHNLNSNRHDNTGISWREITWAYHSESQDILIDIVNRHFQGRLLWKDARDSGLFMWITDHAALVQQFEAVARNEYTKSDMKNPIDCSLFYLALKKKTVLAGLWRMASWNKEQGATLKLLQNNFQEAKWRTVALKNAYALLGKRRYEYAAAFFLLADHLSDAVNVCLNQLQDIQLAITITRIYEGDSSPVLRSLLAEKVLPLAVAQGNRWMASWVFWMLNKRDLAVRALVSPLKTLTTISTDDGTAGQTLSRESKTFLKDDTALVVFYKQLRTKTLTTLKGAQHVTPKEEWEFILRNARLYKRMGCDLLALDLVANWEFLNLPSQPVNGTTDNGGIEDGSEDILVAMMEKEPRKVMRRRSSLVVNDLALVNLHAGDGRHEDVVVEEVDTISADGKVKEEEQKKGDTQKVEKRAPTQFTEPEANSLLDSFGF